MLANVAAALPFVFFCRKEKEKEMELAQEFDKVDAMLFAEQERK